MIGIRQKLALQFGGLLAVIIAVGLLTLSQLRQLGGAIDVILKENYRSVVACQEMKEALERIDSGLLFTLAGEYEQGLRLIDENEPKFRAALAVELGNITLPGENENAHRLNVLFGRYSESLLGMRQADRKLETRKADYFSTLQPLFLRIKDEAQKILVMNQSNMDEANNHARRLAETARRRMIAAIAVATFLAVLFGSFAHRWILYPIDRLIESTNEIRRGNLDLVVKADSRDEIGRLSEAFNEMAAALRQARKADKLSLMRSRRATEQVFHALPDAVAVLDPEGRVEVATETAERVFGLKPGVLAESLGYVWLPSLIRNAWNRDTARRNLTGEVFQRFVDNGERFFQPMALPIPVDEKDGESTGVALILKDVTQLHEQQELKRGVISTVSHQLKTPLTSFRMAIHLLLEERIGPLNAKQADLLVVARDDSERLAAILDDLLDLNRIGIGKTQVTPEPVSPHDLVRDAVEPFLAEAKDKGVALTNAISDALPEVMADRPKIRQAFANLFSNALRFTSPGGSIIVRASLASERLVFFVEDTGKGIPAECLNHLFEQFYRVPGQDEKSGVGLGLAIVKEIVMAHGGDVGVESEVGKGSTFRFSLPLCEGATNAHAATA